MARKESVPVSLRSRRRNGSAARPGDELGGKGTRLRGAARISQRGEQKVSGCHPTGAEVAPDDSDLRFVQVGYVDVIASHQRELGPQLDALFVDDAQRALHQHVSTGDDRGRPRLHAQDPPRGRDAVADGEVTVECVQHRIRVLMERLLDATESLDCRPSRAADYQAYVAMAVIHEVTSRGRHSSTVIEGDAPGIHAGRGEAVDNHERHVELAYCGDRRLVILTRKREQESINATAQENAHVRRVERGDALRIREDERVTRRAQSRLSSSDDMGKNWI